MNLNNYNEGAEKTIQQLFNMDGFWHSFTVVITIIRALVGTLISGKPTDFLGRKKGLICHSCTLFHINPGEFIRSELE